MNLKVVAAVCFLGIFCIKNAFSEPSVEEVDFGDYWGGFSVTIDSDNLTAREIPCRAKNPDPFEGTFEFSLGGRSISSSEPEPSENKGAKYLTSYMKYEPSTGDDGDLLTCTFVQNETGKEPSKKSESIKISVSKNILPPSPYVISEAEMGKSFAITLNLELFPEPKTDDVIWVIGDPEGKLTVELKPSQSNEVYGMRAEFAELGDQKYSSTLRISNLTIDNAKYNYELRYQAGSEIRTVVKFAENLTLGKDMIEEKVKGFGAGLYVIVSLVLLIIIACIVYCIWQKMFKKDSNTRPAPTDPERGNYDKAPTTDGPK